MLMQTRSSLGHSSLTCSRATLSKCSEFHRFHHSVREKALERNKKGRKRKTLKASTSTRRWSSDQGQKLLKPHGERLVKGLDKGMKYAHQANRKDKVSTAKGLMQGLKAKKF